MDGLQKRKRNWWIQRSSSARLLVQVGYTATRGRPSITEEEKRYVDVSNCRKRLPIKVIYLGIYKHNTHDTIQSYLQLL